VNFLNCSRFMVQYIERIDGHVMFWYQLWIKNNLEKKIPISKRGIKGDLNFSCFVILRNVLCDVKISSTHAVILRSVLCDVRISSFKVFLKKRIEKMRSSRPRKRGLRMTGMVLDEILTASKSEASG